MCVYLSLCVCVFEFVCVYLCVCVLVTFCCFRIAEHVVNNMTTRIVKCLRHVIPILKILCAPCETKTKAELIGACYSLD